jgi:hypothetical protein
MIVVMLIVHGLLAVTLLGAITHQAFSVVRRPRATAAEPRSRSFINRFGNVSGAAYANPIVVLFVATAVMGALLYPQYRIEVRTVLEDLQLPAANGVFEIKEHLIAVGLGLLPSYWLFWRAPLVPEYATTRKYLTLILAFLVWWGFLVGHVLNNIRGLL